MVVLVDGAARIHGNVAQQGGGVVVEDGAVLNVSGTARVTSNRALWRGGGVAVLKGGASAIMVQNLPPYAYSPRSFCTDQRCVCWYQEQASLVGNQAEAEGGGVFALYTGLLHIEPTVPFMSLCLSGSVSD